jgi:GntR family transcriptional regulator
LQWLPGGNSILSGLVAVFLQIDAHNGLAVYDQIVRQVKFAVADGALTAGELVPSVRELARELAINPNTVARAYRQLQDDGVIETVRGTGLAVADGARRQCQSERTKLIRARLRLVLEEAALSGLDQQEIEQLVRTESAAIRRNNKK